MLSGKDIYKTEFPPPVWVVEELLPVGLTLAAGRPKVGKSYLSLQIAIAAATGQPALGYFVVAKPAHVLYLALEEPQSLTHRRIREMLPIYDPLLENISFLHECPSLMSGGSGLIDQILTYKPRQLVVLDTLTSLVAARDARKDIFRGDYQEIKILWELAHKHKCAMLANAHSRKEKGSIVDVLVGTSGVSAATDSVWGLRETTNPTQLSLEVKGRELQNETYLLERDPGLPTPWRVITIPTRPEPSPERQQILDALKAGPLKPSDIAAKLFKNPSTIRVLIKKMTDAGMLRQLPDGAYMDVNAVNGATP
jgi:hypothetical protein